MKRYFTALLAIIMLVVLMTPAGSMAMSKYATVVGGWLRLRSSASFNASTINSYRNGTQVEILSASGSWYKVKAPDGNVGYMYGDYLNIGGYNPTPPGDTNATVVSANGLGVRLRSGPGTHYQILGKYSVGTRARILESGSNWSRISINGRTGYMMTRYLNEDGYVPPFDGGDATVWSANGLGVRLRSGPGTGYGKIGVYSVGTRVKILSKGAVWDHVQIGSRTGYMMNDFLIYNNNYVVSEVTLNNYTPVVGNILSASAIVPSNATVTYSWQLGGVQLATTPTYTVGVADVGKKIQLVVTGTGTYSGTAASAFTSPVVDYGTVIGVEINNLNPQVGNILSIQTLQPAGATVACEWRQKSDDKVLGTATTYKVTDADYNKQIYLMVKGTGTYDGIATSSTTAAVGNQKSPTIITTSEQLPEAIRGTEYSAKLVATGGGDTFTWSCPNSLPAGLKLNSSTGMITGTVAASASSQTVKFKVSNGYSPDAEKDLTITVKTQTAPPTFNPNGGTINDKQLVTFACANDKAEIYYTTNGNDPTTDVNKIKYIPNQPVAIGAGITSKTDVTVKAYACVAGEKESKVTEKVFTIDPKAAAIKAAAPAASVAAGAVNAGVKVNLTTATEGASIYVSTVENAAPESAVLYSAPIEINEATTITAVAVKEGMMQSDVTVIKYTISEQPVATLSVANVDFGTAADIPLSGTPISIANTGKADATVNKVTVDSDKFTIVGPESAVVKQGAVNTEYTIAPAAGLTSGETYKAKITVTYDGDKVATPAEVVFVYNSATNKLEITQQPVGVSMKQGDAPQTLTVVATGTGLTYQWYRCSDENKTGETAVQGATDATISITSEVAGVSYYFCKISDGTAVIDSAVVKAEVTDSPNPDVPNPDVPNPDVPNPDNPNPDVPNPDVPNPDVPNPDVPNPDNPNPDVPNPDNPNPDNPNPDSSNPQTAKPELSMGTAPSFAAVEEGYDQPGAQQITIINSGNADAQLLQKPESGKCIILSGSDFTVNENGNIVVSANQSNTTWTIQPKAGLTAGKYSTTVSVYYMVGDKEEYVETKVTFEVKKPSTPPEPLQKTEPEQDTGAEDKTINPNPEDVPADNGSGQASVDPLTISHTSTEDTPPVEGQEIVPIP